MIGMQESKIGKEDIEGRINQLEKRLDDLLNGDTDLEVIEVKEVAIAPRSKLRLRCE